MKRNSAKILCLLAFIILVSCKSSDTMPPVLKSAQDAKALLPGKTWVVKDVGLMTSFFRSDNEKDVPLGIDWFSATKEKLGEYEAQAKDNFGKVSIELKKDSVANATGLDLIGNQSYVITDEAKDDTPAGPRLEISALFKDMGDSRVTFTYIILGANEKTLMLQTPNEVNNKKVVLLLEAK